MSARELELGLDGLEARLAARLSAVVSSGSVPLIRFAEAAGTPAGAPSRAGPGGRRASLRALAGILVASTLLRLALAAVLGLSVDESYTTAIARQFSASYFDHPPLHVWLVGSWAGVVGFEAPWVVRLPFIALFVPTCMLLHRLSAAIYGERAALWSVVALNLAPLFTVGTGSWVLPDGPLACLSLLLVEAVRSALAAGEAGRRPFGWWLLAGVAAGCALLAKYVAAFPIAGIGLYLVSSRHRRTLATIGPWLALSTAVILFAPVIVWNAEHHWASFAFQGSRAAASSLSVRRMLLTGVGQIAYLSPVIGAGLVWALVRAAARGPADDRAWLYACVSIPPVAFFTAAALWTTVLPHWPEVGWLFAFPLLGAAVAELEQRRPMLIARSLRASAAFLVLVVMLMVSQVTTGWLDRWIPSFPQNDPAVDLLDWTGLRDALRTRGELHGATVIGTLSYVDAGKVDYALGGSVPVLCLSTSPHHYAYLHEVASYRGRDVIIVANARRQDWLQTAAPYFEKIDPLPDVVLLRAGEVVLTLRMAVGRSLRPPSPSH